MIPTAFNEETEVLSKPDSMTSEQCECLSVWRGELENGVKAVISCWKPSKEELEEINRTGRVWVIVCGERMPPLAPTGHYPFPGKQS